MSGDGNCCLAATITLPKFVFGWAEPVDVIFRLENLSDRCVTVVKPLISPSIVFFRVIGPRGRELLCLIAQANFGATDREMFTELPAGGFAEQWFDLANLYSFGSGGGDHTVTAIYRNCDDGRRFGLSAITSEGLESNTSAIRIKSGEK